MDRRKRATRTVFAQLLAVALMALFFKVGSAETIKVSGHGEAVVTTAKKLKDQPAINQKSLADAEDMAKRKAIKQAILQIFSSQDNLQSKLDAITQTALDNSAAIVLDKQVANANIEGNTAQVDLILQVDANALRALLESNFNISATVAIEGKFKIYVLSYTVEGMDPNRAQPQVLHEEIVENQQGVHSASESDSTSNTSSHASAASLAASASLSNKGQASYNANASAQYNASGSGAAMGRSDGSMAAGYGSASQSGKANVSAQGSANWDASQSASVDARKQQSSSTSSKMASAASSYEDTSHYYHKVVDYEDPTKKGTALSNEVRVEVESMMTTAGFDVATLNVSMMNREFPSDDDLVNAVLNELRANPSVSPNDYVAIALNSFTPVSPVTHQYTSKVTYRVVRIKDGIALLPAKDMVGDSGDRAPSDDVARTYAVKSAMMKVDDILPGEIKQALQKMQRADQREAAAATESYVIVVDNASTLSASAPIRSALTAAGFKVDRSINGLAKTHTLTVTLNGKTGEDVMNAIEVAVNAYDIENMDNQSTRLKAK